MNNIFNFNFFDDKIEIFHEISKRSFLLDLPEKFYDYGFEMLNPRDIFTEKIQEHDFAFHINKTELTLIFTVTHKKKTKQFVFICEEFFPQLLDDDMNDIDSCKHAIRILTNKTNNLDAHIESLTDQIESLTDKIKSLTEQINNKNEFQF